MVLGVWDVGAVRELPLLQFPLGEGEEFAAQKGEGMVLLPSPLMGEGQGEGEQDKKGTEKWQTE